MKMGKEDLFISGMVLGIATIAGIGVYSVYDIVQKRERTQAPPLEYTQKIVEYSKSDAKIAVPAMGGGLDITHGDMNGDGIEDIVILSDDTTYKAHVYIAYGQGDGTYDKQPPQELKAEMEE